VLKKRIPFFSIAWFIVILFLSFLSFKSFKTDIDFKVEKADKFVHFIMYFVLTSLLLLELGLKQLKSMKFWIALTTLAIFLSGMIEIMQHYLTTHRSGDWYDFFANSIGSISALLLFALAKKKF
jgi:VanZ family protein